MVFEEEYDWFLELKRERIGEEWEGRQLEYLLERTEGTIQALT